MADDTIGRAVKPLTAALGYPNPHTRFAVVEAL
jgi:hypothetical protein